MAPHVQIILLNVVLVRQCGPRSPTADSHSVHVDANATCNFIQWAEAPFGQEGKKSSTRGLFGMHVDSGDHPDRALNHPDHCHSICSTLEPMTRIITTSRCHRLCRYEIMRCELGCGIYCEAVAIGLIFFSDSLFRTLKESYTRSGHRDPQAALSLEILKHAFWRFEYS